MSQDHEPLPAQSGSRDRPVPQELTINSGTLGAVATIARVLNGLTNDKMLTIFVVAGFGYMLFTTMQQANIDKGNTQRMYDDSRERDRHHCDDREDKMARDSAVEAEKIRKWYADQSDANRKFEAIEREKIRAVIEELTRIINKKFPPKDDELICPAPPPKSIP